MHELEPPPDHKGVVTAITIVFAFIFAVAGVFIGLELIEYVRLNSTMGTVSKFPNGLGPSLIGSL